ncbi:hypothetical protein MNBD_ALPHA07-860, partial [hydrothermal vent metagenome]
MRQQIYAYRTNEDGAMVFLTLMFFILFLAVAGLGLATMRLEMNRAKLTAVNDAAILACAGAPAGKTLAELKGIVEDYYLKNGMAGNLNPLDIDGVGATDDIISTVNSTKCSASATLAMPTTLMQLSGVDTLIARAG